MLCILCGLSPRRVERIQKRQGEHVSPCISFHSGCLSCRAFARLEQPCTTTNSLHCRCQGLPDQPGISIHHVLSIYHMPTQSLSRLSYINFLLSIHCCFFSHCNQPLFSVQILSFIQPLRHPAIVAAFFSFPSSVFRLLFPFLFLSFHLWNFPCCIGCLDYLAKATPSPVPIHYTTFHARNRLCLDLAVVTLFCVHG